MLLELYLNILQEYEDKPNLVGYCMSFDCKKKKIKCLNKLKQIAAMNPFYQKRIDRYVDTIIDAGK